MGEGAPHPGRVLPLNLLAAWAAQAGEGTKRRRNQVRAFVEYLNTGTARNAGHAPYRAAGSLSRLDGESSIRPSTQRDGTSEPEQETTSATCVRAEIRHWRDQQTEAK